MPVYSACKIFFTPARSMLLRCRVAHTQSRCEIALKRVRSAALLDRHAVSQKAQQRHEPTAALLHACEMGERHAHARVLSTALAMPRNAMHGDTLTVHMAA